MFSLFKNIFNIISDTHTVEINPATGLPMIENTNFDVGGSSFGLSNDSFNNDSFSSFDCNSSSSFENNL